MIGGSSRRLGILALILALILAGATAARAEAPGEHHDILLRYDPADGRLEVTDRVTLAAPGIFSFRLAPEINAFALTTGGESRSAVNGGVPLEIPLAGTRPQAVLEYHLTLPDLDLERPWDMTTAGRSPEASVLPGYGPWLPVTSGLWSGYRLTVEVPLPQRAVAIGKLVEESERDGLYRAVYTAERPGEPPSVFIGPYVVGQRFDGAIRLRTWFHAEAAAESEAYLEAAARYIDRYQGLIGDYPFAGFDMVSAPFPVGLGFPGLTYISRRIVGHPYMRGRSLAHEILHNWWGNGVRVDYAGGNWCEGLTTYLADYALAAEASPEAAQRMRQGWLAEFTALAPAHDKPVVAFTAKSHQASEVVGYGKVAMIFHMLRREIGEEAFIAGLRGLWQRYRFRTAGWPALRTAFEQASGRDLGWFFDQWLPRPGAPRLTLEDAARRATDGGWRVSLTLRQAEPVYRLSVPLALRYEAGWQELTVTAEGTATPITLDLDREPLALAVDPGFDLFRRLIPGEAAPILRDVTLAADVRTVIAGDQAFHQIAERLAARLLEREPELAPAETPPSASEALLVIAPSDRLSALAGRLGIAAEPPGPLVDAPARAWAGRRGNGAPLVVVTATDAETLGSLVGRLPYYGGESWVAFVPGERAEKGRWPVAGSPLAVSFETPQR